jgi:Spy/CpxP family protein refolding chaperone
VALLRNWYAVCFTIQADRLTNNIEPKQPKEETKMFTLRNVIITIASIAVLGIGINAFAHGGRSWGQHRGNMHYQGDYGKGNMNQMSPEEYKQFEQKREAFRSETLDIRTSLFEKERDLQNELAKDEPDVAQASRLQKEISDLQSRFDQKRIENMLEMRKLNPNAGRGFKSDGPRKGSGGPMMGYGYNRGGGYCW